MLLLARFDSPCDVSNFHAPTKFSIERLRVGPLGPLGIGNSPNSQLNVDLERSKRSADSLLCCLFPHGMIGFVRLMYFMLLSLLGLGQL